MELWQERHDQVCFAQWEASQICSKARQQCRMVTLMSRKARRAW